MIKKVEVTKAGVEFGTVAAAIISWSLNKSVLWMVIHGIFGWGYVIYYAIFLWKRD